MRYDSAKRSSFLLTFKTVANGCSLFLVGLLSRKPLSPKHRSTFLPLQHAATVILSVDPGLGINGNTYTDTTGESGVTYIYRVQAWKSTGNPSESTNGDEITIP